MRSLRTKVILLSTSLVAMALGIFYWQADQSYYRIMEEQANYDLTQHNRKVFERINDVLKRWEQVLGDVLPDAGVLTSESVSKQLEVFLSGVSNREFIRKVRVFERQPNGKLKPLAVGAVPPATEPEQAAIDNAKKEDDQLLRWVDTQSKKRQFEKFFAGVFTFEEHSTIILAKSVRNKANGNGYLVLMNAERELMDREFKDQGITRTLILDRSGQTLASSSEQADFQFLKNTPVSERVLTSKDGFASLGRYTDSRGVEWFGSFQKIPRFNLTVLSQRDTKLVYLGANQGGEAYLRWGALVFVITVFASWLWSGYVVRQLRTVAHALRKLAEGNWGFALKRRTNDEIGVINDYINITAQQLTKLFDTRMEKARFQKEKEVAHSVHQILLPKGGFKKDSLTVVGFSTPASECGGDWWGHFSCNDGVEYVVVADAMGHGVQAALVTSMVRASCLTLISLAQSSPGKRFSPSQFVKHLNNVICDAINGAISVTVTVLMIDIRQRSVSIASGGHLPPVLFPLDPMDDRIKKKDKTGGLPTTPVALKLGGTILGVNRDAVFEEMSLPLRPGDKFILYTDGIVDCTRPDGEAWGKKNLMRTVLDHMALPVEEIKERIVRKAFAHYGGQALKDDVTVVLVEFAQSPMGSATPMASVTIEQTDRMQIEHTTSTMIEEGRILSDDPSEREGRQPPAAAVAPAPPEPLVHVVHVPVPPPLRMGLPRPSVVAPESVQMWNLESAPAKDFGGFALEVNGTEAMIELGSTAELVSSSADQMLTKRSAGDELLATPSPPAGMFTLTRDSEQAAKDTTAELSVNEDDAAGLAIELDAEEGDDEADETSLTIKLG